MISMKQLEWDDLSRWQKIETLSMCLFTVGSALFVVRPVLIGLHPMFTVEINRSNPLGFLLSPGGIAILAYCIVVYATYSYVRFPEYW